MQVYSCRMRIEQDSKIKRLTHIVLDDGTLLYTTEKLEGQLSGKTWSYRTGIMTIEGKAVTVAVLTQDTYQNRMSRAFKAKMVRDADKSVSPVGFLPFRQQKISGRPHASRDSKTMQERQDLTGRQESSSARKQAVKDGCQVLF